MGGAHSEGVRPAADFLHCPLPAPLIFLLDNVPTKGCFPAYEAVVAAAAPTDVAQDWGVGNPGGLGNGKGNGTWEVLRSLAGPGK